MYLFIKNTFHCSMYQNSPEQQQEGIIGQYVQLKLGNSSSQTITLEKAPCKVILSIMYNLICYVRCIGHVEAILWLFTSNINYILVFEACKFSLIY